MKGDIENTLNSLLWHDSELRGIVVFRDEETFALRLELNLFERLSQNQFNRAPMIITFRSLRILRSDIDFRGLTLTGGAISSAFCSSDTSEARDIERNNEEWIGLPDDGLPLRDCFQFEMGLIPPGGSLKVFAKDVEIDRGI